MNTFQVILLCVFGGFLVLGVMIFAIGHFGGQTTTPPILMWGTISNTEMRSLLEQMDTMQRGILKVTYVQKNPDTFDKDFTEAVATGVGPDLVLVSQDNILTERNKLYIIPFATLADRTVIDTFIQEADLFKTSTGYLALPFIIDPLVMYWNRDLFQGAGLAKPPQYWDEFSGTVAVLNKKDQAGNILQSAISFGEFSNVANAKSIISTLIMQAGNPITLIGAADATTPDEVTAVLDKKFNAVVLPAEAALDFYTQFADPSSPVFSWNKSLPLSTNMFLAGNLATYFGFASEYASLQSKNPNLNFDVAPLPQPRSASAKITFGNMLGLGIVKNSPNLSEAYRSLRVLIGSAPLNILSGLNNLPPTRRDLLATSTPQSAALTVFNAAALQSRGWLDPNPQSTNTIFSDMIESIKSGSRKIGDAIGEANVEIQGLIK